MHIYHIAAATDWSAAEGREAYSHPSLAAEGFIHLSSPEQLAGTIERYYETTEGLVLLEVDPARLDRRSLVWEPSTGGENYPHLYSELPVGAVVAVHYPSADGSWQTLDQQPQP